MLQRDELQAIWYARSKPALWLRGLARVFGALAAMRRVLYRSGMLRRVHLPVPVVIVGNLSLGGTGKTPLVVALVQALRERGFIPGVVSRGYGGSARLPQLLDASANAAACGDEPVMIADATAAPVAIGRDRVAAAHLLLAQHCDVIIADDGLQHYRLCRDVEICVIDGERRVGNGRLFPAGPLREPPWRLRTVDFCVCNGGSPAPNEVLMRLSGEVAVSLADADRRCELREFAGQRVHAVAGIGNPQRFFAQLRQAGLDVVEHAFSDHHAYSPAELDFGDTAPVLMTSKDAVKCRKFARASWWQLPVHADLPPEFFDAVAQRVHAQKCT